jgi:Family of unknown function (DUF6176)
MYVELSRFRVKPGKSARVDEWMKILNANMGEIQQALDREQMKLEVIFREMIGGEEYLYWFSVQSESGEALQTSPFAVDQKHMAFHAECIDYDYGMRHAQPQVVIVPDQVAQAMGWTNPTAAAVQFQRRELIDRRRDAE